MLALAGFGVACAPTKPPAPPAPPTQHCVLSTPTSATAYQNAFDGLRNAGTGWLASDGGLPVTLPDDRILWMFGDTIIGSGPGNAQIGPNNSFVVQDGNCFRPVFGGVFSDVLPDPGPDQWLWPTAAVVEGSNLRVFALHMEQGTGGGPLDFEYVRMEIATFALPGLTHLSTVPVPIPTGDPLPSYGQTIVVANDGGTDYVHAYGKVSIPGPLFGTANHYVARVPLGQVLTSNQWQVWDGTSWSTGSAAPLLFDPDGDGAELPDAEAGPLAPLAVAGVTVGFLGSALDIDVFGDQLETWDAVVPQGPFEFHALARDIWPTGPPSGQFGYGGRVVFDIPGAPIALWSVNHESPAAVLANLSLYKVNFATPNPASVP